MNLDLLILSSNYFHVISLIRHITSLYPIIVLLLLLYTQLFLRVRPLALCFFPCSLSLCQPLLVHTIADNNFLTYIYRCLLFLTKYPSHFTLCSHVYVMSKLGQLLACLNLVTTRQNSCLSPPKGLIISITYLLQSLLAMLNFPSNSL